MTTYTTSSAELKKEFNPWVLLWFVPPFLLAYAAWPYWNTQSDSCDPWGVAVSAGFIAGLFMAKGFTAIKIQ